MKARVTYLRRKCAVLSLVLTGKWYDMIAAGEKREEYRAATPYWEKRLWNWNKAFTEATIPAVEFRLGYARNAPRMAFWVVGLPTPSGILTFAYSDQRRLHPEWGEPSTPHFIIRLGGPLTMIDEKKGCVK